MLHLYRHFPRQIAVPYRINVKNQKEFYAAINKHNGKRRVFSSLYNYTNGSQGEKLLVDKIWFDMDSTSGFEALKKFVSWAEECEYRYLPVFSGGGFHFYILTKNYRSLKNPKYALGEAQKSIAKELNLSIGKPDVADIDCHIVGDVARVVTIVNTFNLKRNRYAIPLTLEDIQLGEQHIRKKAAKQDFDFKWQGSKLFDISKFDGHPSIGKIEELDFEMTDRIRKEPDLKRLPACISAQLMADYVGFRERFHVYNYLRDSGYSLTQVKRLVKKHWSHIDGGNTSANLADYIIKNRQIDYVFARDNILAANCSTLAMEGFCCKRICKFKDKLYL